MRWLLVFTLLLTGCSVNPKPHTCPAQPQKIVPAWFDDPQLLNAPAPVDKGNEVCDPEEWANDTDEGITSCDFRVQWVGN